jgi:hypothetical protein
MTHQQRTLWKKTGFLVASTLISIPIHMLAFCYRHFCKYRNLEKYSFIDVSFASWKKNLFIILDGINKKVRTCLKNSSSSNSVQRWCKPQSLAGWLMSAQCRINDNAFNLSMLKTRETPTHYVVLLLNNDLDLSENKHCRPGKICSRKIFHSFRVKPCLWVVFFMLFQY